MSFGTEGGMGMNGNSINLAKALANLEIAIPKELLSFSLGQKFAAIVFSRKGDQYLLQAGNKSFYAQSQRELPVGKNLTFLVTEQHDGKVFLKIVEDLPVETRENKGVENQSAPTPQNNKGKEPSLVKTDTANLIEVHTSSNKAVLTPLKILTSLEGKELLKTPGDEVLVEGKDGNIYVLQQNKKSFVMESKKPLPFKAHQNFIVIDHHDSGFTVKDESTGIKYDFQQVKSLDNSNIAKTLFANKGAGLQLEGVVQQKIGDIFVLTIDKEKFYVRSEDPLPVEKTIKIVAEINKEGKVLLKAALQPLQSPDENTLPLDKIRDIAKKYGLENEKDIERLHNYMQRIPGEDRTAIRYLLDTNLLAALLFPRMFQEDKYDKLEVIKYQRAGDNQKIWEICFDLQLEKLGHIEARMKMIDERIYTQLWAESSETEEILRGESKKLSRSNVFVEIVPVLKGPLIVKNNEDNIDLMV